MEKTPITPDIPALEDQTSSVLAATKKELLQLDSLISSTHLTESEIQKKYCTLPDDQISLLCSYTTRLEGFLDILLSGNISSSKEAERLLGKVHTHRGDSMGRGSGLASTNDYISFSTGLVSFKYFDHTIRKRENFQGGVGCFIPLGQILKYEALDFSHCSDIGGLKRGYDRLTRDNILPAVQKARKDGELFDDGGGNVFEIEVEPTGEERKQLPKIPLSDTIIAIPLAMKEKFEALLLARQQLHQELLVKLETLPEVKWGTQVGDRFFYSLKASKEAIKKLTAPFDLESLPIFWYPQRNLELALQYLSLSSSFYSTLDKKKG